jgi:UDP-N-acetylmuramoyl-L-alanyl-D-glutamate--2,6-diaminopimelate ligase
LSLQTSELARALNLECVGGSSELAGVSLSALEVVPGDLFVAIAGQRHHGLDFLEIAIERGASAVLTDRLVDCAIPVLVAEDPKALVGKLCDLIMGENTLPLLAVTGTNGKTSTTSYLFEILSNLGISAAMSGSTGRFGPMGSQTSSLTTPELTTLRKFLAESQLLGAQLGVLEVSAQALVRNRVDGLKYQVSGFTNLSRDHLDDFGSMSQYLDAKARLFEPSRSEKAVVFIADEFASELANSLEIPVVTVGRGADIEYGYQDGAVRLSGLVTAEIPFRFSELMGRNLALAVAMLFVAGYQIADVIQAAGKVGQVPGRLERVSDALPHTFVDYAHTPDGVEQAIAALKSEYPGVTVLLAASGNRDQGKRELMGLAARGADQVIVTDQHPRDEDPAVIRSQLIQGLKKIDKNYTEIADPEAAISFAVSNTPKQHAVLWCGPGHLKYREIAGQKLAFDAKEIARLAVESNA